MATRPYDWQRLASPAPSSSPESGGLGIGSHHGVPAPAQHAYSVDPFYGSYPRAPHLRPIELPETNSPMPVFVSPGYNGSSSGSSSSRSRHTSLPALEVSGLGIYAYGIPSPPISPQSSRSNGSAVASGPNVHPLLRGDTAALSAPLAYNVLHPPAALRTRQGARINERDLTLPATHPAYPTLRVSVILYPSGPSGAPRRLLWDITLAPSRRSFDSSTAAPLRLGDALASLHLFVLDPVSEDERRRIPSQEIQNARAVRAARQAAYPTSPAGLVRADFLYGCTEFAGFVRNADNSFVVRLVPPSARA